MDDKKRDDRGGAADEDTSDRAEAKAEGAEDEASKTEGKGSTADRKRGGARSAPEKDDDEEEDDEEEDDEEEEEEKPAVSKPAAAKKSTAPATKKAGDKAKKAPAAAEPARPVPVDPVAMRNGEVRVGLITAIVGYLAFWGAWMIYTTSIGVKHVNFFSHSAWLFMIAYALVTIAAFYFVRLEPASRVVPGEGKAGTGPKASPVVPRTDRTGIILAVVICGPVYAAYWWVAKAMLQAHYAQRWWAIELVAFAVTSFGVWWGMRPPTVQDELAQRMPTRRITLLMMVPFMLVFGMIWLASAYPPWPS